MHGSLHFFFSLGASLLPRAWRERLDLNEASLVYGTWLTALGELVLVLVLCPPWFHAYRAAQYLDGGGNAAALDPGGGNAGLFILGLSLFLGFFLTTAKGLLLSSLFIEGMVRLACGVARVPLGNYALGLIVAGGKLLGWWKTRQEAEQLAKIPDLVDRLADGKVRITSPRRREWDGLVTIRLAGEFYTVERFWTEGPRYFYLLAPIKEDHLIRVIHDF